ncbi:MAG: Mfa1 family fimbria major subunit [Odoribacteraceae bacterium]|jgi:hypothetical protein|nr:Mfa1 family fimbria major subunit [Odoribacteraceae bacterium]
MKYTMLNQVIIACMITFGLVNCTRNNQVETFAKAEETTIKLNIEFSEQSTRAPQDQSATDDETKVSTLDVFIFDAGTKRLENRVKLTAQDIEKDPTRETYNSKAVEIRAMTGSKLVAAGINLPASFPEIATSAELQRAWEVSVSTLNNANGIVMFSKKLENPTLVTQNDVDYATNNTVTIKVERTLAKIAVQDGGFVASLSSGVISDASFAMRNSNTRLFPMQVIENGIVKDPNWATAIPYSSSDFEHFSDYVSINAKTNSDRRSWNTKYVPENTIESPLEKTATYASIRVKFTPAYYTDGRGNQVTSTTHGDFWTVVRDGTVYYFNDKIEATQFAVKGGTVSETYKNGYAYYNAFINVKNGCNVYRNAFYNVKISLIVPPGSPTPGVENPESPIKESTNIKVSIDLEDWDYQEDEYPLS